jgi:hypothetical protein
MHPGAPFAAARQSQRRKTVTAECTCIAISILAFLTIEEAVLLQVRDDELPVMNVGSSDTRIVDERPQREVRERRARLGTRLYVLRRLSEFIRWLGEPDSAREALPVRGAAISDRLERRAHRTLIGVAIVFRNVAERVVKGLPRIADTINHDRYRRSRRQMYPSCMCGFTDRLPNRSRLFPATTTS